MVSAGRAFTGEGGDPWRRKMIFEVAAGGRRKPGRRLSSEPFLGGGLWFAGGHFLPFGEARGAPGPLPRPRRLAGAGRDFLVPPHLASGP